MGIKTYSEDYPYYDDHTVKCPYYKDNGPASIRCEGVEEDMSHFQTFNTRDRLLEYKGRYCRCMNYHNCIWAEALDRKWGYTNGK